MGVVGEAGHQRATPGVLRTNAAQPGALKAMVDWYRAFLRGGGLRRQMRLGFPPIPVPVLMLWGEEDTALAKYTTDGTGEFAPRLDLRFLPGVSHWVQQGCDRGLQLRSPGVLGGVRQDR